MPHKKNKKCVYIIKTEGRKDMNEDNVNKTISTTEETLKNVKKLLSNLDDILFKKDLRGPNLNIKDKKDFQEDDMLPITWDSMFKTMIYNDNRIQYSKFILDDALPNKYKDFSLYKSETNKDTNEDKEMTVDYAAIKDDLIIDIEMNNSNTLERNANYLSRLCSKEIKKGEEYIYFNGLQININGFKPPHNKTADLYYTRDRIGNVYIPQIFVNIYLQNLWELYYNVGVEGLSQFERSILVMTSKSKKEAEKLAKGDEIMEEYIKDAKNAMTKDKNLRRAYDHEVELAKVAEENGRDKGREEGRRQEKTEIATNLLKCGMTVEFVHENTKLPIDEIKKLKNSFSKEVME